MIEGRSWSLRRRDSAEDPRRGVAAIRLRGIFASRRRDSSPWNIRVAAAASPRLVSTECPGRDDAATRLRGISASRRRRDPSPRIVQVATSLSSESLELSAFAPAAAFRPVLGAGTASARRRSSSRRRRRSARSKRREKPPSTASRRSCNGAGAREGTSSRTPPRRCTSWARRPTVAAR